MSEWHRRYGGRSVQIYWHVERGSVCIHSQLKTLSSSEVATMIQGVLHHCTEMEIDRHYVDSHSQSTVGFAFGRLLGFELLPRLKAIHSQRLYRPEAGQPDEMGKYAEVMLEGTAGAESILRRFTRNNLQHPTYL